MKSFGETSHKWILQQHAPVINYAMKYSSILTQLLDCWIWFTSRHSMRTAAFGKFHTGKGTCHASHHSYFKSAHLFLMHHVWGGVLFTKMEKNDATFFRKTFIHPSFSRKSRLECHHFTVVFSLWWNHCRNLRLTNYRF